MFNFDYYKIDDELPDLKYDENQSGIDLYVREKTTIMPSVLLLQTIEENYNNILNKPIKGKDIIDISSFKKPQKVIRQVIGCFSDFFKNVTKSGGSVQKIKNYTDVPLNIVIKGNIEQHSMLYPRSSLFSKYGLLLANSVGVIDPSYSGINDEVKARIINFNAIPVVVEKGERLCQLVLFNKPRINELIKHKEHWGSVDRGGFGSTGGYLT